MTGSTPKPGNALYHLVLSALVLIIGLLLTNVGMQAFQASMGDGTLGTYTVTGITGTHQVLSGTFISANRDVVIKNMGYNGNPPLIVGTTVKVIKPSWSWLGLNGESVFGPGPNPADKIFIAICGVVDLLGLIYLTWSIRYLIRVRRAIATATLGARPA